MAMKLLPKSEIDRLKAVEKKAEIDEGLKLARKIDNLREVRAAEEAALETFRRETLTNINEEISQKVTERDTLKAEVTGLEKRKKEAQEPLDNEWVKVSDTKAELDRRGEGLDARESILQSRETELNARERFITKVNLTASGREERAIELLKEAEQNKKDTKLALEEAQKTKEVAEAHRKEVEESLVKREQAVSSREEGVKLKEEAADAREVELNKRETQIADREATLERTLKRIK